MVVEQVTLTDRTRSGRTTKGAARGIGTGQDELRKILLCPHGVGTHGAIQ